MRGSGSAQDVLNDDLPEIKKRYTEGHLNDMEVHSFESLSEILYAMGYDSDLLVYVREVANSENWGDLRRYNKDKLDQAKRIEVLNQRVRSSEEFDNDVMRIAKAGLQQIKAHFAISARSGEPLSTKDVLTLGNALQKYQIAGRLALGDTADVINDKLDNGVDLGALTKEELKNLNSILKKAESNG